MMDQYEDVLSLHTAPKPPDSVPILFNTLSQLLEPDKLRHWDWDVSSSSNTKPRSSKVFNQTKINGHKLSLLILTIICAICKKYLCLC